MEELNYRETLAWLMELFDGKVIVTLSELSRKFKTDRRTLEKRYPFNGTTIELTRLASAMCMSMHDVQE